MDAKRRKFFRGAGLIGALVAGVATSRMVNDRSPENDKEAVKDISALAPVGSTHNLHLTADNRTAEEKQKDQPQHYGKFTLLPSMKPTNQVALSVGKDNRLWIKVDDEWKRIAIEG